MEITKKLAAVNHYTALSYVGGISNGTWFKIAAGDPGVNINNVVNKLEFWANDGAIVGCKITFSDGTISNTGDTTNYNKISYTSLSISAGEIFTSVIMWSVSNDAGTAWCARIEIETTRQSFAAGTSSNNVDSSAGNSVPIGCGTCVGFYGTADPSTIYSFGLLFYDNVATVVLDNVIYTNPPSGNSGINPLVLDNMNAIANGGTINWEFTNILAIEQTQSFAESSSVGYFASVTVKAALWGVGLEASAGWNQTETQETTVSTSQTTTISWNISGSVDAGNQVDALATIYLGKLSIAYTGDLTITFTDDTTLPIKGLQGIYNNLSYGLLDATATYSSYSSVDNDDKIKKPLIRGWLKKKDNNLLRS